jgi:hypothetical protein
MTQFSACAQFQFQVAAVHFQFRVPPPALHCFFSSSSVEFCENYQFLCEEGSYLLLHSKISGLLSYWGGSSKRCSMMSFSWECGGGLGTLLTRYFSMLSVQFSRALQCLCIAIDRSRIVVHTVPVLGQVSMDKRDVKANCQ